MMSVCEIEIDGPRNENLRFRPLQRSVRGRFDWHRCGEPESHRTAAQWGSIPVPSQRLGFDTDTLVGYVAEPLHSPEHAALAERIAAKGLKLPPAREEFQNVNAHTWAFWLYAAVRSGLARVATGKLPAFDESQVQKDFLFGPRQPTPNDRLSEALIAQADAIKMLAAAIADLKKGK